MGQMAGRTCSTVKPEIKQEMPIWVLGKVVLLTKMIKENKLVVGEETRPSMCKGEHVSDLSQIGWARRKETQWQGAMKLATDVGAAQRGSSALHSR